MSAEHGLYVPPDPNITHYSTGHHVQRVTVDENFIMIEDPQAGNHVITRDDHNGLYYDYLTTVNATRSGGISQLCKDQACSTIPNAASMTRRWHCNGLVLAVDYFARQQRLSEEVRLAHHLATDGDDTAHPLFSHGTEQAVQEWGGPENFHEEMWPEIAALGGTAEVLRKHDVKVDDKLQVPGIEIPQYINGAHPDVTLDRFQYGVTEMLLWYDHEGSPADVRAAVSNIKSCDNLQITDDSRMAFKDLDVARIFAKGYLLLSTEHWNDPINRVQLHLLIQATQRAIIKRRISWMDEVDKRETRRPEHYIFGIDNDVVAAMETGPGKADDFMYAVKNALYPIALQERQRFIDYKLREYGSFLLDASAQDYPSEYLDVRRVEFGPPSSQVAVAMQEASDPECINQKVPTLDETADGIRYRLGPLKNRFMDPLVIDSDGQPKRLSDLDPNFKALLAQQQELQVRHTTVELAFAGGFEKVFKKGVASNNRQFAALKDRSPMTRDQQRRVLEIAARNAAALGVAAGTLVLKNS